EIRRKRDFRVKILKYAAIRPAILAIHNLLLKFYNLLYTIFRYRCIASTTDPGSTTWSSTIATSLSFDHHFSTTGRAFATSTPESKIKSHRTYKYLRECSGNTHVSTLSTSEPRLDIIAPENTLRVERFLKYPRKNLNP
ncbi:hypothetical protein V1478_018188, partial [Vespula squamosa]